MGVRVRLSGSEKTADYPLAASATVDGDGNVVVLHTGADGPLEPLDRIPEDRWVSWTPYDPDE